LGPQTVGSGEIAAPALVTCETANVIRKHELAGQISPDQSAQAHADLLDLAIEAWPYDLLTARAWELPEITDLTLITLDKRLAKAPGTKCRIATP
jgi:predicted nucleic acid-binding protein